ncbi:amidohydrolase [Salinibacterium sp. NK8237]|uniref:amidohydrolase n=1 Tax=Salinibacterium sp. NK8237 TaxID=2792038 RepID=UPI0018CD0A6F|nr:amidohydrolase [Salinibacterium sp. NK8237]MBH0129336.1 amidohydrolase family protein [Salinibacterium sp. NK8237]
MKLTNARIVGNDASALVDVTLTEGRISAIEPHTRSADAAADDAADSGATDQDLNRDTIDLDGRWIMPGLWDQHVHSSMWAQQSQRLDLSHTTSATEVAVTLATSVLPESDGIIVGQGFRDALWPDQPTRELLDSAVSDIAVVLVSGDLHSCWLNSLALERFGFYDHPTGFLREEEAFAVGSALSRVEPDILDGWIRDGAAEAASRGVVGIVDLEMTWEFENWQRRMLEGFDLFRVRVGVYPRFLERAIFEGLTTGQQLAPLLEVGPFKIITDGSLNTRTAYCVEHYPGEPHNRGVLNIPADELIEWIRTASGAGLSPAVHAIGDDANTLALNAFEIVGCRGRIEHAQSLSESDLPRFAALGIAASVQPEHAMDDRDVADALWPGRNHRTIALRSMLDAGIELLMGSDAPVAPLDPWAAIASAVSRSRDGREPWYPEQRITVAEALTASAQSTIAVGEVADIVVTRKNPLDCSGEELRAMRVDATILAGRFTHNQL